MKFWKKCEVERPKDWWIIIREFVLKILRHEKCYPTYGWLRLGETENVVNLDMMLHSPESVLSTAHLSSVSSEAVSMASVMGNRCLYLSRLTGLPPHLSPCIGFPVLSSTKW